MTLRDTIPRDKTLIAVMKGNAYGHGAVELSKVALQHGATMLAVARVDEAIELREAGIEAPILMLCSAVEDELGDLIEYEVIACVNTIEAARMLSDASIRLNQEVRGHLEVDTGMARNGFFPEQVVEAMKEIQRMPGLKITGIFTHFATADEVDTSFMEKQYQSFCWTIDQCEKENIKLEMKHCCNSPVSSADNVEDATMLTHAG